MNIADLYEATKPLTEEIRKFPAHALARMLVFEAIVRPTIHMTDEGRAERVPALRVDLLAELGKEAALVRLVAKGERAKRIMDRLDRGEPLPKPRRRRRTTTRRTR